MVKILLHTGERRHRVEEPLILAGNDVLGIQEEAMGSHKLIKLLLLVKILIREEPDLIIIDSAGLMCLSAYVLGVLFRVPLVLRARADIWSIYEDQSAYTGVMKRIYEGFLLSACTAVYKRVTHIFSVSHHLKERICEKGVKDNNISVMRFSIDVNRFLPHETKHTSVKLLSVVNFTFKMKTQGLLDILPVIDELISTYDIEFFIAGRGQFSTLLEETLTQMNHGDKIHYLGFQKDIEKVFSQSDIYIQYSYLDAYPAAVLEAMASGLPVIALRQGGMVEQVTDGVTGFLVDDVMAFKDALEKLLVDDAVRKEMGKRGRAFVQTSFTDSSISKSYKEKIESILYNKGA